MAWRFFQRQLSGNDRRRESLQHVCRLLLYRHPWTFRQCSVPPVARKEATGTRSDNDPKILHHVTCLLLCSYPKTNDRCKVLQTTWTAATRTTLLKGDISSPAVCDRCHHTILLARDKLLLFAGTPTFSKMSLKQTSSTLSVLAFVAFLSITLVPVS